MVKKAVESGTPGKIKSKKFKRMMDLKYSNTNCGQMPSGKKSVLPKIARSYQTLSQITKDPLVKLQKNPFFYDHAIKRGGGERH